MSTIERLFHFDESIRLPQDTVISYPDLPTAGTLEKTTVSAPEVCVSPANVHAFHTEEITDRNFIASSLSKASYIVLPAFFDCAFRELLAGSPIRRVYDLLAQGGKDAESIIRNILTQLCMRNFFEDASASEFVPDGSVLHFYVTNRCNLNCKHCYMSSGSPLSNELSTEEKLSVLRIFSEIHPAGKVTFSGGEALTCNDSRVLLETSHELGLRTELYTNGTLISEDSVKWLMGLVDVLQISLDGATASVNDAIRGRGTFDRIVKAIRLVAPRLHTSKTVLRIAMTITPVSATDIEDNLGALIDDLHLTTNYKISIGSINRLGRAGMSADVSSSREHMLALQARVIHTLARQGLYSLPTFSNNLYQRNCGLGGAVTVAADGSIYPCTITEQPRLGNVRQRDARSLMKSVKDFLLTSNVDNVKGCSTCDIRYLCGGTCRINNFKMFGTYNTSTCTSQYKQAQLRNMVRRYESFRISARVQAS